MFWNLVLFLLVLGLAYAGSRLLGRQARRRPGGLLQLRDSLSLGRDRSLVLVEVGGRLLLVGATPQAVTLLSPLDGVALPAAAPAAAAAAEPSAFGPLLALSLGAPAGVSAPPAAVYPTSADLARRLGAGLVAAARRLYPPTVAAAQRALTAAAATGRRLLAAVRPAVHPPLQLQRAHRALAQLAASLDSGTEQP